MTNTETDKLNPIALPRTEAVAPQDSSRDVLRRPETLVLAYAHHGHAVPLFASVVPHRPGYVEIEHEDDNTDDPSALRGHKVDGAR